MFNKISKVIISSIIGVGMSGCAQSSSLTQVPQEQFANYHVKTIATTLNKREHGILVSSQSPEIKKAFIQFQRTGKAPIIETDAFLEFPYGNEQPIVVCEPLKVCDIELEAGEFVTGIRTGDSKRWKYDYVYSGENDSRQAHIIFRPKYTDISTNVIITTSRRAYYLGLLSKGGTYVRQVKFYYPEEMQQKMDDFSKQRVEENREKERSVVASIPTIDPTQLDDHYSMNTPSIFNRNPLWKPIRVFNDGTHVYIQMPAQLRVTDAPVFFVTDSDGNQKIVNYRVKHNYYIIDVLFKQAVMISGAGSSQEKIYINYNG
jgi:P-type conjugative transfer protein TrbG